MKLKFDLKVQYYDINLWLKFPDLKNDLKT